MLSRVYLAQHYFRVQYFRRRKLNKSQVPSSLYILQPFIQVEKKTLVQDSLPMSVTLGQLHWARGDTCPLYY